jgi:hypothetical protein
MLRDGGEDTKIACVLKPSKSKTKKWPVETLRAKGVSEEKGQTAEITADQAGGGRTKA